MQLLKPHNIKGERRAPGICYLMVCHIGESVCKQVNVQGAKR